MSSRRGRLNWSNIEIRISDPDIERQHRFNDTNTAPSTCVEEMDEGATVQVATPPAPATKPAWRPKSGVGELHLDEYTGNYMLTSEVAKRVFSRMIGCVSLSC